MSMRRLVLRQLFMAAILMANSAGQQAPVQQPASATRMCPDFLNCLSQCGVRTECLMVSCCADIGTPGTPIPTCLNHARYCAAPTVKGTQKCRRSNDCLTGASNAGTALTICCLNSAGSEEGLCSEIPCAVLCPTIVPGYHGGPIASSVITTSSHAGNSNSPAKSGSSLSPSLLSAAA